MMMLRDSPLAGSGPHVPETGEAEVQVLSLAGSVLAELPFGIERSVDELKAVVQPLAAPDCSRTAVLHFMFDGQVLDGRQTLRAAGICAGEEAYLTLLIEEDDATLVSQEAYRQDQEAYRQAVARSRREAAQARQRLRHRRRAAAQAPSALTDTPAPLMLQDGAAPAKSRAAAGAPAESPPLMLQDGPVPTPGLSRHSRAGPPTVNAPTGFTPEGLREARAVRNAYCTFFDHIAFRKGWRTPPFTQEEASAVFASAAGIVARARLQVLNVRDPGLKVRQISGSAVDWMHDPGSGPLLRADPGKFLVELVHATFKDGNGYVEGLTAAEVSSFIRDFQ